MSASISQFRSQADSAINDLPLQEAIDTATGNFWRGREGALEELPDSEGLRDHFKAIRSATLAQLDEHLESFESNAKAAGTHVHWAEDAAEACRIVIDIGKTRG